MPKNHMEHVRLFCDERLFEDNDKQPVEICSVAGRLAVVYELTLATKHMRMYFTQQNRKGKQIAVRNRTCRAIIIGQCTSLAVRGGS